VSPDRSFFSGMLTGVAAAAVVVQIWFAVLLAPLRETYSELNATAIPPLTAIVISRAWQIGVPLAGAAVVLALIGRRPSRLGPYLACAMMLAMTCAVTWWCSQSPLRALAEGINDQNEVPNHSASDRND
jgi:hypothetical protein